MHIGLLLEFKIGKPWASISHVIVFPTTFSPVLSFFLPFEETICRFWWMWELDYKESWAPKNWCFWTVVLEKTLESPLDCKTIKPVNPQGNQSWMFTGRTDAEAETPILWPPDIKNLLIRKDPDAGKVWRQEEKGTTEDEMDGWHHRLNGHEFEQAPGAGDGQGSLACCSPWGCKESDTTEQLNWTVGFSSRQIILIFLLWSSYFPHLPIRGILLQEWEVGVSNSW